MKLAAVCFTAAGARLCAELAEKLGGLNHEFAGFVSERIWKEQKAESGLQPLTEPLSQWTGRQFEDMDGIVFICAAGIAVRAVAPYVRDKTKDPAVVVMDEASKFAIPVLSGHLGGANELAAVLADITGAVPVITTATDVNGLFAVDDFARRHGLALSDMSHAKAISAALLDGQRCGFFSDFPIEGQLPGELLSGVACGNNLWITAKRSNQGIKADPVLKLIPKITVLGIGCRRGTETAAIEHAVESALCSADISPLSIMAAATIDIKKAEPGLLSYTHAKGIPLYFYDSETLRGVEGEFTASPFVESVTGVDNVCERAAIACVSTMGRGTLLMRKYSENGVTVAAAVKDWKVVL